MAPPSLVLYANGAVVNGQGGIGLQCPRDPKLCVGLKCPHSDPDIVTLVAIIEGLEIAAGVGYTDTIHLYTENEAVYHILRMPGNYMSCWPENYIPFGDRYVEAKKRFKLPHIHLTTNANDRMHKLADERAKKVASD